MMKHVITLANSIIGVSVLAMPFCFKQCGIVLATLSLMVGAVMTRMVCYFLLKSALMSRRRTYEMLAWSTFGHTGKFLVEISIIGFLIGTLIAFMVVIGDLGPEILSEMFSVENNSSLRTIIMTALSIFVALPLGLLRNIDSLSSVSTASILFYLFLVIKIVCDGFGPLWSGEYLERIHFWKSAGVLQCIPIFSMALSCQTQVFGIYDALPEPSLQKMNEVVKRAVYVCTFFYFCVGFFGYIAFSQQNFGGNILLSFSPTWSTQLIKSMFLMSVVFSVPLVVFPCRTSLHSLMFRSATAYHHVHDMSTNYIPESRMKYLTVTIVGFTLIIGIMIPNIELVLGLVGSTTGSVICIIFPSIMFVRVTSKNTTERLLAQLMFIIGVVLMLLTTYATLYAAEQSKMSEYLPEQLRVTENGPLLKPILPQNDVQLNSPVSQAADDKLSLIHKVEFEHKVPEKMISNEKRKELTKEGKENRRTEPLNPPPPVKKQENNIDTGQQEQPPPKQTQDQDPAPKSEDKPKGPVESNADRVAPKPNEPEIQPVQKTSPDIKSPPKDKDLSQAVPSNIDKVDKPQSQVKPEEDGKKDFVDTKVAEEFLKRLEEHQENQKKILEEQKEILEVLKQHHAHDVQDKIEKETKEKLTGNDPEKEKPVDNSHINDKIDKVDININPNKQDPGSSGTDNKRIQEQEKIIEKISENLEKESKNAQLLEKLEENLEGKLLDAQAQVNVVQSKLEVVDQKNQDKNLLEKNEVNVADNSQVLNKVPETPVKEPYDVLKGIDKEKGVLVGSLGAKNNNPSNIVNDQKLYSQPKSEPNTKQEQIVKIQVPEPILDGQQLQQGIPNQLKNSYINYSDSNKPNSDSPVKENVKLSMTNQLADPPPSPNLNKSNKKSGSENSPKEKVDREM